MRGDRSTQSGQVLPVALVFILMIGAVFYFMVNAGQSVTEKIRVTNAADAAAYSAAVVEARALNYDAYLNRAMVANELAIAQMVSFASWMNYFATSVDYFPGAADAINYYVAPNSKIEVLDGVFGGTWFITKYFGTTVQTYVDLIQYGMGAIISVHDLSVQALSASQSLMHLGLIGGQAQQDLADTVVQAMDPNLRAEVVVTSHTFDSFTKAYAKSGSAGDERGRFADVTMRSRDDFTKDRSWTISGSNTAIRKSGALKKRGGTDLIGFDEWRGVDTLEVHGKKFGCGHFHTKWCKDVRRPVGWGAVEIDAGGGDAGHDYHGNAYDENSRTAGYADSYLMTPPLTSFSGIPSSREIADVDPSHDPVTAITVLVSKSHSKTLTSGNAAAAAAAGRLALYGDHPSGGEIMALSRAQVFFDRIAQRDDGKQEIGSLYNPYWRVRLIPATVDDKAYAAARQGLALP